MDQICGRPSLPSCHHQPAALLLGAGLRLWLMACPAACYRSAGREFFDESKDRLSSIVANDGTLSRITSRLSQQLCRGSKEMLRRVD